ncbi:hypothetical protein C7S16_5012 [Burkholderia thailandensis]|uniref:Uncharacterized protein n=1 Tax=Burkholderia thailandensis TaxID=57975 RepID=A0AAW9CKR9_BURTH|nr:hypothetical protein [Burkholderia thailandensis]
MRRRTGESRAATSRRPSIGAHEDTSGHGPREREETGGKEGLWRGYADIERAGATRDV